MLRECRGLRRQAEGGPEAELGDLRWPRHHQAEQQAAVPAAAPDSRGDACGFRARLMVPIQSADAYVGGSVTFFGGDPLLLTRLTREHRHFGGVFLQNDTPMFAILPCSFYRESITGNMLMFSNEGKWKARFPSALQAEAS